MSYFRVEENESKNPSVKQNKPNKNSETNSIGGAPVVGIVSRPGVVISPTVGVGDGSSVGVSVACKVGERVGVAVNVGVIVGVDVTVSTRGRAAVCVAVAVCVGVNDGARVIGASGNFSRDGLHVTNNATHTANTDSNNSARNTRRCKMNLRNRSIIFYKLSACRAEDCANAFISIARTARTASALPPAPAPTAKPIRI